MVHREFDEYWLDVEIEYQRIAIELADKMPGLEEISSGQSLAEANTAPATYISNIEKLRFRTIADWLACQAARDNFAGQYRLTGKQPLSSRNPTVVVVQEFELSFAPNPK